MQLQLVQGAPLASRSSPGHLHSEAARCSSCLQQQPSRPFRDLGQCVCLTTLHHHAWALKLWMLPQTIMTQLFWLSCSWKAAEFCSIRISLSVLRPGQSWSCTLLHIIRICLHQVGNLTIDILDHCDQFNHVASSDCTLANCTKCTMIQLLWSKKIQGIDADVL